jgi:hypothetical protein
MKCAILVTTDHGQDLAGTFELTDGQITSQVVPGFEVLMSNVLADSHFVLGKPRVTVTSDPLAWFNSLPKVYNGSYLRAQVLDGTEPPPATPRLTHLVL